jgi:hypothetical protein
MGEPADAGSSMAADYGAPLTPGSGSGSPTTQAAGTKQPHRRRHKKKKWVPPIPVRYKRRDVTPGPGAYDIGWTRQRSVGQPNWERPTHGALTRSNRAQDTRAFYFGAGMACTSAAYGRDSPGPVYQVTSAATRPDGHD